MNTGFPGDGTTFVGHNATLDNGANTRTWAFLTPGEGMNIDWYFVNKPAFDAYMAQIPAYNASKSLLAIIEEAKAKGVDVSAQQAVYENEAATVEEINAQLEYREENKAAVAAFHTTRVLGENTRLLLDEDACKFIVTSERNPVKGNPDVLDFSQVTGCQLDIEENCSEAFKEDEEGNELEMCNVPKQVVYISTNQNLKKLEILRRKK